jgi:transmembrane sensor
VDELILQVLTNDAPPEVIERVRAWRAESEANDAYYRNTARVWALTEPEPVPIPRPGDVAAIVAAAEARRARDDPSDVIALSRRPRPRALGRPLRWGAALAAAIAAVAIGLRMDVFVPGPEPTAEYVASPGETRVLTLDDGSFVKLAAGSTLRTWDSRAERRVTLEGRGFFAVAQDPARPFVVGTGDAETRVVGTRFEVAEVDDGVRAIVVEGVVSLSNEDGSVDVPAGSVARATEGQPPSLEPAGDIYAVLDWPGGAMLFQATPLAQVAREVERRFDRSVEVVGPDLQAVRISGTLEEESFEEVVLALCQTAGADCVLTDSGAQLRP